MPSYHDVCVWFIRETVGDFRVSLKLAEHGQYRIKVLECDARDSYKDHYYFDTYEIACAYLDVLIQQALNDQDPEHPFINFQYSVPYFPTVLMPMDQIACERTYKDFTDAVDFFFSS
jgi:hypothetical protein